MNRQQLSRWVDHVDCVACHAPGWRVVDGVWTCRCGQSMSMTAIQAMQKVRDA